MCMSTTATPVPSCSLNWSDLVNEGSFYYKMLQQSGLNKQYKETISPQFKLANLFIDTMGTHMPNYRQRSGVLVKLFSKQYRSTEMGGSHDLPSRPDKIQKSDDGVKAATTYFRSCKLLWIQYMNVWISLWIELKWKYNWI